MKLRNILATSAILLGLLSQTSKVEAGLRKIEGYNARVYYHDNGEVDFQENLEIS